MSEKCPACGKEATGLPGLSDIKKHISKCAEHERRWLREGSNRPTPHLDHLNGEKPMTKKLETLTPNPYPLKEVLAFEKNGIRVCVKIDYQKRTISLVDSEGNPKKWLFSGRELGYMNGWLDILSAMQYAVQESSKRLDAIPSVLEMVLINDALKR